MFQEVIQSKFKSEWKKVTNEEMSFQHNNDTWELVEKTANRTIKGCKWIFKMKEGLIGSEPRRFKANLVEKG